MKKQMNLYQADRKMALLVESVPGVELLDGLGLRVGTRVRVQARYAFGGPVLLRVEDSYSVAVGKDIATQIGVERHTVS